MRSRRRSKSRRQMQRQRIKPNFTPVIVMLCLSVGCGYAAAKYVVEPAVNYVPEISAEKTETEIPVKDNTDAQTQKKNEDKTGSVLEDEADVEKSADVKGYALQFGCYSDKAAAENVLSALGITGLQVMKQDNMYKITGTVYKTKEEAKAALKELPDNTEAFVTEIY